MSVFDVARRVALPVLAKNHGITMREQGRSYGSKTCPCCGEGSETSNALSMFVSNEGIWRWKCWRCNMGGTAIDYAAAIWGVTDNEAARRLASDPNYTGATFASATPPKAQPQANPDALKEVLDALVHHGCEDPKVLNYLVRDRGIGANVVKEAAQRGIARALPSDPYSCFRYLVERVGEGRLRAAGLWKEGSKWPAIAYRPLVFLLPEHSGAEFRMIREPSGQEPKAIRYGRLEWPWFWRGDLSSITVVEGAIDMMSLVTMGERGSIMGLPGATSWREAWFKKCAKKYPQAEWRLGLDSDAAGKTAAEAIETALAPVPAKRIVPTQKDWNEMLMCAA